jgi:hypothetical protein
MRAWLVVGLLFVVALVSVLLCQPAQAQCRTFRSYSPPTYYTPYTPVVKEVHETYTPIAIPVLIPAFQF